MSVTLTHAASHHELAGRWFYSLARSAVATFLRPLHTIATKSACSGSNCSSVCALRSEYEVLRVFPLLTFCGWLYKGEDRQEPRRQAKEIGYSSGMQTASCLTTRSLPRKYP